MKAEESIPGVEDGLSRITNGLSCLCHGCDANAADTDQVYIVDIQMQLKTNNLCVLIWGLTSAGSKLSDSKL
jgi:hypothetical protein